MTSEAIDFFRELGLELEGRGTIEGEWAGRVTGLADQRVEIAMMRAPDGRRTRLGKGKFCNARELDEISGSDAADANCPSGEHRRPFTGVAQSSDDT